jgi:hypothetical protein
MAGTWLIITYVASMGLGSLQCEKALQDATACGKQKGLQTWALLQW